MKPKEEKLYTFVPNHGIGKVDYNESLKNLSSPELENTRLWFEGFKPLLENRSTYRLQMKGAPYFAIYNVGDYVFKPWKVIWPEMSTKFYAAVASSDNVPLVGLRPYVPDHKVYYAAFDTKQPAYFLCGLLNTNDVKEWVESHNVSIQVGDVFKHMNLPEYDAGKTTHSTLASLVEAAHNIHERRERLQILREINELGSNIIKEWANLRNH